MTSNELNHSGVRGMKWGVWKGRSALYKHGMGQKSSGKLTFGRSTTNRATTNIAGARKATSSKSSGVNSKRTNRFSKKTQTAPTKEQVINSGDAKIVKKYSDTLSNEELNRAVQRVNLNRQLDSAINTSSYKNGESAVKKIFKGAKSMSEAADTAIKLYNSYARVSNTFRGTDHPVIKK